MLVRNSAVVESRAFNRLLNLDNLVNGLLPFYRSRCDQLRGGGVNSVHSGFAGAAPVSGTGAERAAWMPPTGLEVSEDKKRPEPCGSGHCYGSTAEGSARRFRKPIYFMVTGMVEDTVVEPDVALTVTVND